MRDGSATVFTGKVELGQGIVTALRQIAAEELDLPLARVTIVSGDTGRTPNEGMTAGSQSVENSGTALRMAAAEVRAMLIELASARLEMSADSLSVADGVVSAANGRKVSYAELAASLDLRREATATVRPKPAGLHTIVGQSVARLDIPGKVTGKATYVQDLRLPGMTHGRVVRPPRYGATLESVDDAKVRAIPGLLAVVRDGSFLGVIAEREEQAVKARAMLAKAARWKGGPELPDPARIFAHLKSLPTKVETIGVKQATAPASAKVLEATYTKPYTAHASIGPSAAVAEFRDGKFTVWTHSQGVFPLRAELAKALKVAAGRLALHPHRGLRLLRPQRRRRRRARRRAAGARLAGPAGAAAMDARRRVRLGALRARDGDAGARGARCRRAHHRMELRAVEQYALHPPDVDQRHQRARRLVSRPRRSGWARRPARRSRPAAATATRSRCTISRTRRWCTTSSRRCRSGCRRCAGSAPTPTCSPANPSWTSWRWRRGPIRSRFAWRI